MESCGRSVWNLKLGIPLGLRIWNLELGIWNLELGTWSFRQL